MNQAVAEELPARIQVSQIISARYNLSHQDSSESSWYNVKCKPLSWDDRKSGLDTVMTVDGRVLKLWSDGSQSVPQPGWVLLLTGGNGNQGYTWTLYGLPPQS